MVQVVFIGGRFFGFMGSGFNLEGGDDEKLANCCSVIDGCRL